MEPPDASRALLVIGDGPEALPAAERLAPHLNVVFFAPDAACAARSPVNVRVVGGRIVSVTGHAGAFRAHAAADRHGKQEDVGCFSPHADGRYDLVLDLGHPAVIPEAQRARGYFAPRGAAGIAAALAALQAFLPPQPAGDHLTLEAARCTLGRQDLPGCQRCAQACDAGAIRFEAGTVSIETDTCNGCAACTLACPTGALSSSWAPRERLLGEVQSALRSPGADTVRQPVLVVHARGTRLPASLPARMRALEVPALPAFGDELWLSAWASGFRTVLLVDNASLGPGARRAVDAALVQARALGAAAGREDLGVALVAPAALAAAGARFAVHEPHAPHAAGRLDDGTGKRGLAVAALLRVAHARTSRATAVHERASFGSLQVDARACTLCLACANACPTGALAGSLTGAMQRLMLRESACVQCGLCAAACPEHAVALVKRVTVSAWRDPPKELAQDPMVRCSECRTPFATRRVQQRASALAPGRAARHPQGPGALCAACRSRSVFSAA